MQLRYPIYAEKYFAKIGAIFKDLGTIYNQITDGLDMEHSLIQQLKYLWIKGINVFPYVIYTGGYHFFQSYLHLFLMYFKYKWFFYLLI